MNMSLLISWATKVGLWTYESYAALQSCTPPHVCVMCVVCMGWAQAIRQNKMFLSFIILIPLVKLTNQKRGTCRHLILYFIRIRPSFPNDAQTLRPKASVKPNQILNWLEECYNGKYSLSNEQKSNFGNRMTKVAISGHQPMYGGSSLRMWAKACVHKHTPTYAARVSET